MRQPHSWLRPGTRLGEVLCSPRRECTRAPQRQRPATAAEVTAGWTAEWAVDRSAGGRRVHPIDPSDRRDRRDGVKLPVRGAHQLSQLPRLKRQKAVGLGLTCTPSSLGLRQGVPLAAANRLPNAARPIMSPLLRRGHYQPCAGAMLSRWSLDATPRRWRVRPRASAPIATAQNVSFVEFRGRRMPQ